MDVFIIGIRLLASLASVIDQKLLYGIEKAVTIFSGMSKNAKCSILFIMRFFLFSIQVSRTFERFVSLKINVCNVINIYDITKSSKSVMKAAVKL